MKDEKDREINGLNIVLAVDAILENGNSKFISNGTFSKSDFDGVLPDSSRLTSADMEVTIKRLEMKS